MEDHLTERQKHLLNALMPAIKYGYTTSEIASLVGRPIEEVGRLLGAANIKTKPLFKYAALSYRGDVSLFSSNIDGFQKYFQKETLSKSLWKKLGYLLVKDADFHWSELPNGCLYCAKATNDWHFKENNSEFLTGPSMTYKKYESDDFGE